MASERVQHSACYQNRHKYERNRFFVRLRIKKKFIKRSMRKNCEATVGYIVIIR